MSDNNACNRLKSILDDESRGAWILGVSLALHKRLDYPLWCCRAAALVSLIFLTIPSVLIYVGLGYYFDETRAETHKLFKAWGEILEKFGRLVWAKIRDWNANIRPHSGVDTVGK